jgi:hypothetical protein
MSCNKQCLEACKNLDVSCPNSSCRNWIEFEEEYNCVLYTVDKAQEEERELTLRDVAKRLGCSFVRVKQIEDEALVKLNTIKDAIY